MSDRLYLPPFNVGHVTQNERLAEMAREDDVVSFVTHSKPSEVIYLDTDHARMLRDKLSEILGDGSRTPKSEEWQRLASEPATDAEIESYKRHEGCSGSCLPCLEKLRLIARIEAAERALRPEEVAYLLASKRCETCPHRTVLHDHENDECDVPGCDCGLRRWKAEHEGLGHTIEHVVALPSAPDNVRAYVGGFTRERWNCSCRSSYEIGSGS